MREKSVAVIGDKDALTAYKAVGVDAYPVVTGEEARDALKRCARSYRIIFVTEEFCGGDCAELIERYKTRAYPVCLPVPSAKGSLGIGMQGIKRDVEKAVGTDVLFNKEEK